MNEGKEIREIMDDINGIIQKLSVNESYVFDGKQSQQRVPSQMKQTTSRSIPMEEEPENHSDVHSLPDISNKNNNNISKGFDERINQIRKIALNVLSELEPSTDPESYKLIKGIWDSCDKYLTKDSIAKPQNNNNNI